jgi:cytochrome c oxidase assembly protein subunit 15
MKSEIQNPDPTQERHCPSGSGIGALGYDSASELQTSDLSPRYNRPLHLMALFTAIVTFPLIFMGGLVTSHSAGMSVPDWPNSYGYNMFLFPPRLWIGGILYEHTHRLMASFVGFCAIALTIIAWKTENRRWVRWLATSVLGMVIFQGVLGGLRVVLVKLDLAIVHACIAQAFFCLAALVSVVTSRWWLEAPVHSGAAPRLLRLAVVCVVVVYGQLIIGALMRHNQAGLAIPDLPLAYGKLLPPTSADQLAAVNHQLVHLIDSSTNPRDQDLPRSVTMFQVWIHFAHRLGALIVTGAISILLIEIFKNRRFYPSAIKRPAILLLLLLVTQITLGVLTILLRKPADVASAHVAVGALVLVTCFVLSVRGLRLYASAMRGRRASDRSTLSARSLAEHAVVAV